MIPELLSLSIIEHLNPFKSAWSLNNQIVLTVVDYHVDFLFKQIFHQVNILIHEIRIEALVYVATLLSEGHIIIEHEPFFVIRTL
jgi:hypothetical protein